MKNEKSLPYLDTIYLLQVLTQTGHEGSADGEGHQAVVVEGLGDDGGFLFLDDTHDLVHQGVLEGDGDLLVHRLLNDGGSSDGLGCCGLVGLDETAGTELDTSEIADYDDENICQLVGVDLPEDWLSCGSAGLAIVVGTENKPLMPKHIGIADVTGVVVFLGVGIHQLLHLLDRRNRKSEGKKLASLLRYLSRGGGRDGEVGIGRPTPCQRLSPRPPC